ncbi:MAG: outer membrane protein assembly factor BamA [Deltaproteobacteria bacterium]|nr:outer membrane protein assembly factor BamA [Deltaproteobacteria bacterium]
MCRALVVIAVGACLAQPGAARAEAPDRGPAAGTPVITKVELKGDLLESRYSLLKVLSKEAAPGLPFVADSGPCALPDERPCPEDDQALASEPPIGGDVIEPSPASQPAPASQSASAPASQPRPRPAAAAAPATQPTRFRGTACRLRQLLSRLSYRAKVTTSPSAGGVEVTIQVRPKRLIRKVYIAGNWPLFEEEILRLVRFRPSQAVPLRCALAEEVAASTRRIKEFLARQGYFDGSVIFILAESKQKYEVNVHLHLKLGRRYKVDGIRVDGNVALRKPDIERLFHHRAWYTLGLSEQAFTTSQLKEDLHKVTKRYHDLGYPAARVRSDFSPEQSIDRKTGQVRLTVTVHEGRRLSVVFRGNRRVSADSLRKVVSFSEAGSYDEFEIEDSARRIRDHYQSKGYFRAKVTFTRKRLGETSLRVTYTILEGPQLKVRGIDFVGNWSFGAKVLRGVVQTRTFPWLGYIGLGQGGYVTETQVKQDEERLVAFYQARGFMNVQVKGHVTQSQTDHDALYVRFTIDEGPRITVESVAVEFVGRHERSESEVMVGLTLRPGVPLTPTGLKLDAALILRRYASQGHPYVELEKDVQRLSGTTRVRLVWKVKEGRLVRVGEILIRGTFKTWRHVILNEIPLKPGDRFDIAKSEQAERNLRTLGLFRTVQLTWLGLEDKREVVHLLVHVEERHDNWAAVEIGVGFSTDTVAGTAAFANATVSQGNLFGLGYTLSFLTEGTYSFTLGTWSWHLNGTFMDPRWFGKRLGLELKAYWRVEDTIRLGRLETYGTSASITRELYPGLAASVRYDLKRVLRNETLVRPSGPLEDIERVQVPTDIGSIGGALALDRRDHPLAPTRGYRLSLGVQVASRYLGPAAYASGEDFVKLHAGAQGFIPLGGGLAVVQGVRYDHGFPLRGAALLPRVERFYAGGDTTIRGFEQDSLRIEVVRLSASPLPGGEAWVTIPQGGNIRIIHNLELVFPIWRKSIIFGLPINGALLLDSAILVNSFDGTSLRDIRHSAGVAFLRLATPVGSLSFEYATPLNPHTGDIKPGDKWRSWPWNWPGRVHFNFGFVF